MYWEFKYDNFRIYFKKEIEVLKVLKLVFNSDLNPDFFPEMY